MIVDDTVPGFSNSQMYTETVLVIKVVFIYIYITIYKSLSIVVS